MQTIYQDKDEGDGSRRANSVGPLIYTERISRYMEGKHIEGFGRGTVRI